MDAKMTHGPIRDVSQSATHSGRLQGKSLPHHSHFGRRNSFHQALILLSMVLSLTLPAKAQYVQGGALNVAPDVNWGAVSNSFTFTFSQPLMAPCTVLVGSRYPIDGYLKDSQGNTFLLATNNPGKYDQLWYAPCKSGPDTITVGTFPSPGFIQATFSVYAGTWIPDQLSPEVQDGPLATYGATAPITPTQNGELILGIGNNHTLNAVTATGSGGFTVRAIGNQFIEDQIQATAAPIYSEVTYSSPVVWCQWTISFKSASPPPPPHSVSLTWAENNPPAGTTFNVYRGIGPQCTMVLLANVAVTNYTDSTIVPGTGYCYQVKALLNGSESDGPFICAAMTVQ